MFDEYQFLMITFNQAHIIEESLNSIKQQIVSHGSSLKITITIIDDCSTDDNAAVIKKWMEVNSELFFSHKIIVNESNLGIKGNVLLAHTKIISPNYYLLAGDDLLEQKNSIFEYMNFCSKHDVVFSLYYQTGISRFRRRLSFSRLYFYKHFNRALKKSLPLQNILPAPGAHVHKKILQDQTYIKYMESAIEDYEDWPTWRYLFVVNDYKFQLCNKSYYYYRSQNNAPFRREKINLMEIDSDWFLKKYSSLTFFAFHTLSYAYGFFFLTAFLIASTLRNKKGC